MNINSLLPAARGVEPADMVLRGGRIVNVFSGRLEEADLAVKDGIIVGIGRYEGLETVDVQGLYLTPGLIDAHLHIESTMLCPPELARAAAARGTVLLVADPHEIANVLGIDGVRLMMDMSGDLPADILYMAPSCVPATGLETSGAVLGAAELASLADDPRILGLAEMMNFPGLINGDPEVLAKLELFRDRNMDGHAPLLSGPGLAAYVLPGIGTEHEATNVEEALEKIARGLRLFIREGSQAHNLEALLPVVDDHNWRRVSFCTDDRHPADLLHQGHMDHILRRAVSLGLDPVRAVSMATINTAEAYGLRRRGALAPGYAADIVVWDSLNDFNAVRVFKNGRPVAANGRPADVFRRPELPDWACPMNATPPTVDDLSPTASGPKVRVLELIPGQLLTRHLVEDAPLRDGKLVPDAERDLALAVVVERHRGTGAFGLGLVRGFGLQKGALASSVAHDSHNIVAVGADIADLAAAVRAVMDLKGGLVVVESGRTLASLPLPLAGLMSLESLEDTARNEEELNRAAAGLGCTTGAPFMSLSFLALPVIPSLRLTDRGLVDVNKFDFIELFTR